jgi:uncharacterized protein (DUF2252 family)
VSESDVGEGTDRQQVIVDALVGAYSDLMDASPEAFRSKFRKMAADPFAFYRGSAPVFYADLTADGADEPWTDERSSRVWIHGDLHAENFGTYMDGDGVLIFDVNDFDEAYIGPYTWDVKRFAASVALMGWQKALSDENIGALIGTYVNAYVDQVRQFVDIDDDHSFSLRLDTAKGAIHEALQTAKLATRVELLDSMTVVDGYDRVFREGGGVRRLDDDERAEVEQAFERYIETIPESKRYRGVTYRVLDVVGRAGFGIGSAGLPAYNVLIEGLSQALDNDLVLSMKQGNVAAVSRVIDDERVRSAFDHHGHRTAVSQRALQAHADRLLGWTEVGGTGFVVNELSPYEADLDWEEITEPEDMGPVLEQLGRATAKAHCVSDEDTDQDQKRLVGFQTEEAISTSIGDRSDDFVQDIVDFAMGYARRAREDHSAFVEAFRAGDIPGVTSSANAG